jgi:farnesyl diphosphate synthase
LSAFAARLAHSARLVEARLGHIIDAQAASGSPQRLTNATRHAVLGGGKRFRPFLVLECAALFEVADAAAVDAAAALECIHCYSLVHDDLPAMDNDELRRGQPTVWKAYDEWTAILVGDGLQALAFEILSNPATHADPRVRADLVQALAQASGNAGMVGGQALDLEAGKLTPDAALNAATDIAHVAKLQAMKTGRLIRVACEMGAILGGASAEKRAAATHYGECIGFAFQISDDLLDAEGSSADVGKATGKDAAAGKATLVSLTGAERAREHLDGAVQSGIDALKPFGARADVLIEAARFMGRRGN